MPVYLIGTLDTKGHEVAFARDELRSLGVSVAVIDASCLSAPSIPADIPREKVFEAAGTTLEAVRAANDRGHAVRTAAQGIATLIARLHAEGSVEGVIGLGGSAGTTIATSGMRVLPIGVPKVMASTLASGQVRPYVGDKDILMLNTIVDVSGINRISRIVLGEAARAMAGLVTLRQSSNAASDKPVVGATMFGVTTPCVERARKVLEDAGYEVLVFHATGTGGQAMESLIADGLIAGVLDITTTELADELVGGVLSAGPNRLTAAGRKGIPQVISVGALDMVNFGPLETVPTKFAHRKFYQHNPTVTLMRTTEEENKTLGEEVGRKSAAATGPTAILFPLKGVSAIDREGQPFDDRQAREALLDSLRRNHGSVELIEIDHHINDSQFAEAAASKLIEMLTAQASTPSSLHAST
jgi:uncharacterized protein (UPF0261 family)